jgi:hypothetical protein
MRILAACQTTEKPDIIEKDEAQHHGFSILANQPQRPCVLSEPTASLSQMPFVVNLYSLLVAQLIRVAKCDKLYLRQLTH